MSEVELVKPMIQFTDLTHNKIFVRAEDIAAVVIASNLTPDAKNVICMPKAALQSIVSAKEALSVLKQLGESGVFH